MLWCMAITPGPTLRFCQMLCACTDRMVIQINGLPNGLPLLCAPQIFLYILRIMNESSRN